jgi:stalled ribosome rescue protein Dom34
MDRNVGLWIDHKQAYIIWHENDKIDVVLSNIEPPAHFSGGTQRGGKLTQKGDLELHDNDRYRLQLTRYYQQVLSKLRDVNSIFIMGPGEAKVEFLKALKKQKNMENRLLRAVTADKMTMNQMIAYVKKFYQEQAVAV